ncbi:permease [Streptomyces albireticuli]|uniref:permease n=1 Tax=Streptomyces albireticuli TaxID=1940 RepID=UPI00367AB0E0
MIDLVLRLYPAGYRSVCGEESGDVHREMVADMPRAARLRADADLAAHALRVRLAARFGVGVRASAVRERDEKALVNGAPNP